MGYRDKNMILSDGQSNVRAVAEYVSTNLYDCGNAQDNGVGFPLQLDVRVGDTAFGSVVGGLEAVLETCDTVGGTYTELMTSGVIDATSGIAAGTSLIQGAIPANAKQFLQVRYKVTTLAMTLGTLNAQFLLTAQNNTPYASGVTV